MTTIRIPRKISDTNRGEQKNVKQLLSQVEN